MKLLSSLGSRRLDRPLAGDPIGQPALATGRLVPARAPMTRSKRNERYGDVVIGGLGVTLGLVCALFPWFIFFNQDKFGVREMQFEGHGSNRPAGIGHQSAFVSGRIAANDAPRMDVDLFPTGTLPDAKAGDRQAVPAEQPFPADAVDFKVVHVANGRAMIEDGDGLWVVQPGSRLPDASRVASIERRDGRWVLVTTLDKVVELER